MNFYEMEPELHHAVEMGIGNVRIRLEIAYEGIFRQVEEIDILEATFTAMKEAAGGIASGGTVLLSNEDGKYDFGTGTYSRAIKVALTFGECKPYFRRFVLYADHKGIREIRGPGKKNRLLIRMHDCSMQLKEKGKSKNWDAPVILVGRKVCDSVNPEFSLLHGIAECAGLDPSQIDCSTIDLTIPYAKLRDSVWEELSGLATAYRCRLEFSPTGKLVFQNSPYQQDSNGEEDGYFRIEGNEIFMLTTTERYDLYANSVRFRANLPERLGRQEIWRYEDAPILYDENEKPYFPFRGNIERRIEKNNYEAEYKVTGMDMEDLQVLFADEVDSPEQAEARLQFSGGPFGYLQFDTAEHLDKALIMLNAENDGDLFNATIHGRPIVMNLNRSCFRSDTSEIKKRGLRVKNTTGAYYSECEFAGIPHYEDWVKKELAERVKPVKEYTIKTHKAIFNAKIGADMEVDLEKGKIRGVLVSYSLTYKAKKAFVATLKILGGEHG